MRVDRRTFLIGFGFMLTAKTIESWKSIPGFAGEIGIAKWLDGVPFRAVADITMSCMPDGKETGPLDPVQWSLWRGDECIYQIMMHPHNTCRWVGLPGSEFCYRGKEMMRVLVEPSYTNMVLNLNSNVEPDPVKRQDFRYPPTFLAENFRFRDGSLTLCGHDWTNPALAKA